MYSMFINNCLISIFIVFIMYLFRSAYSRHTPFVALRLLELVSIIKYRISLGEWDVYYCYVVSLGCPRVFLHGTVMVYLKFVHRKFDITKSTDISVAGFFVPLFGSVFWGLYWPLIYIYIRMDSVWYQEFIYVT